MKYSIFLLSFILVSCGSSSSFNGNIENPASEEIQNSYDSEAKKLDLSGIGFSGDFDLGSLIGTGTISEVTHIDLSDNDINTITLPYLPNLDYLDLSDNQLDDEDIQNFPKIKLNKTYLDVSGNNISQNILDALELKMKQYHPDIK